MNGKIAFIKFSEFSHTNAAVLAQLIAGFPEHEIIVLDVADAVKARKSKYLAAHVAAMAEYGLTLLSGKRRLRTFRWRTGYMSDLVRRVVATELSTCNDLVCTFQTQSLFNCKIPGIPHFVYTDHTLLANLQYPDTDPATHFYSRSWIKREPFIYHDAVTVFTMSSNVTHSLVQDYSMPPDRICQVGVGCNALESVDLASLRPRPIMSYTSRNILFVGTMWELKGGPELVEAYNRIRATRPDIRLSIVGVEPDIAGDNITIYGRVPLHEVSHHYRNASIFCMPSKRDAFGIVFLEALANRLPVVALNIGATPDLVTPGITGELVAPGDIEGLTRCLADLVDNPEKCKRMGDLGFEVVVPRYTWDHVGRLIVSRMHEDLATMESRP